MDNKKILELIDGSSLRDKDKGFIQIHLDTYASYIRSLQAKNTYLSQFIEYTELRAKELTEKSVLLNVMLNQFYDRFTDEEIKAIRTEAERCLKNQELPMQT